MPNARIDAYRIESYSTFGSKIFRVIERRDGIKCKTQVSTDLNSISATKDLGQAFDLAWLQNSKRVNVKKAGKALYAVDLFAGCGGLSLGVKEGAKALGFELDIKLAVDTDKDALAVFGLNFPETELFVGPVEDLLTGKNGEQPTHNEVALKRRLGRVDIVIGGPPCQGHSALNNHTRGSDERNELYLKMARFCEIVKPKHVLIENVPGVLKDKHQVAQKTWKELERMGYFVQSVTIDVSRFGVAQKRKRNLTIASLLVDEDINEYLEAMAVPVRPLKWAIKDLEKMYSPESVWDSAPNPSSENKKRMKYLFDRDLFDLPDSQRPDCHRLKQHSYVSVYGRLHWGKPAQTITTGFGSMGRGRNVHPAKQRTITPHEAARIQFFPDSFSFGNFGRTLYQKFIGNAVPPKLGYLIGVFLFR